MATQLNTLEIGDAAELQRRLTQFTRQFPQAGTVKVAFTDAQHADEVFAVPPLGEGIGLDAGCIAKLFTAALLSALILRRRIRPDDCVVALLPLREKKVRSQLLGVTVAHLLNHMHGLDDTALGAAPLRSDGTIDCDALCMELLCTPPLFAPGALYNYGRAGGYLAGALVEQLYARPFGSVLESELLKPLGVRLVVGDRSCVGDTTPLVCPSTGGHWRLTEMDVLKFLAQQLTSSDDSQSCSSLWPILQSASQRLPAWSPTEQSINLGWKGYGQGWYGHDGRASDSSMLARINVERRIALVISCAGFSGNDPSYVALSRLFRDWFPELTRIDAPRSTNTEATRSLDLGAFTGTYQTRASSIAVYLRDGELFMRIGDQAQRAHRLRAATETLFLAAPAEHDVYPYVQFIRPAGEGRHEYLWNGQNVWRRCS